MSCKVSLKVSLSIIIDAPAVAYAHRSASITKVGVPHAYQAFINTSFKSQFR